MRSYIRAASKYENVNFSLYLYLDANWVLRNSVDVVGEVETQLMMDDFADYMPSLAEDDYDYALDTIEAGGVMNYIEVSPNTLSFEYMEEDNIMVCSVTCTWLFDKIFN